MNQRESVRLAFGDSPPSPAGKDKGIDWSSTANFEFGKPGAPQHQCSSGAEATGPAKTRTMNASVAGLRARRAVVNSNYPECCPRRGFSTGVLLARPAPRGNPTQSLRSPLVQSKAERQNFQAQRSACDSAASSPGPRDPGVALGIAPKCTSPHTILRCLLRGAQYHLNCWQAVGIIIVRPCRHLQPLLIGLRCQ